MVNINLQLYTVNKIEIQWIQEIFKLIVKTIITICRQEVALRGYCNAGLIKLLTPLHNDGNFRALLWFQMVYGENILIQHLLQTKTYKNRVTRYTSLQIQNEIIEIYGKRMLYNTCWWNNWYWWQSNTHYVFVTLKKVIKFFFLDVHSHQRYQCKTTLPCIIFVGSVWKIEVSFEVFGFSSLWWCRVEWSWWVENEIVVLLQWWKSIFVHCIFIA